MTILVSVFNVKNFGAKGDARKVSDGVLNSTTTVTSATANFTSSDAGKIIFGVYAAGNNHVLPTGTIVSVNSSTSITVSIAAIASVSGVQLIIGTADDSDAIRSACTAAKAVNGTVSLPAGGYIFSKLLFDISDTSNVVNIIGEGQGSTFLFPLPSYDFATTSANHSIVLKSGGNDRMTIKGFTLDCLSYNFNQEASSIYPLSVRPSRVLLDDVRVVNTKGFPLTAIFVASLYGHMQRVYAENNRSGHGIYFSVCHMTAVSCYAGNCTGNSVYLKDINGDADISYRVHWLAGNIDESDLGALYVDNSEDVRFGGLIYGPPDAFAATVDGTSRVEFAGADLVPFGGPDSVNRGGLKVLSGGVARISGCRIDKSGTAKAIDNAGTIYDLGGNEYTTSECTGTLPIVSFPNMPSADPHVSGALWNNAGVVNVSSG